MSTYTFPTYPVTNSFLPSIFGLSKERVMEIAEEGRKIFVKAPIKDKSFFVKEMLTIARTDDEGHYILLLCGGLLHPANNIEEEDEEMEVVVCKN